MNTLKRNLHFVLFLTIILVVPGRSGNHTVTTTVEVTQTAINRYLNTQYNAAGFPRNIPVNISGTNYTISLTLPDVVLSTGNAKLHMVFDVWQGTILLYHFTIQPSINIPSGQITALQVQAFLTNLQAILDAVAPVLPLWVKSNIVSNFNSLGWTVYPSKLIDQLNTAWFAQRGLAINITNLALGWEAAAGTLRLTISVPMTATGPRFYAQFAADQHGYPAVIVKSYDIDVTVDEVRIFDLVPNNIQTWTDNVLLPKGAVRWWYTDFTPNPTQLYFIWILFRTDNTFMVRKFKADGQGLSSHLFSSIN
jgi:hypothetical protein